MFQAKQIHSGQYKRYGDSFYVWEIETNRGREETVDWCFENLDNLYKCHVPEETEWRKNIRLGGEKSGDMGYYFAGYYTIRSIEGGFKFTVCKPYAD